MSSNPISLGLPKSLGIPKSLGLPLNKNTVPSCPFTGSPLIYGCVGIIYGCIIALVITIITKQILIRKKFKKVSTNDELLDKFDSHPLILLIYICTIILFIGILLIFGLKWKKIEVYSPILFIILGYIFILIVQERVLHRAVKEYVTNNKKNDIILTYKDISEVCDVDKNDDSNFDIVTDDDDDEDEYSTGNQAKIKNFLNKILPKGKCDNKPSCGINKLIKKYLLQLRGVCDPNVNNIVNWIGNGMVLLIFIKYLHIRAKDVNYLSRMLSITEIINNNNLFLRSITTIIIVAFVVGMIFLLQTPYLIFGVAIISIISMLCNKTKIFRWDMGFGPVEMYELFNITGEDELFSYLRSARKLGKHSSQFNYNNNFVSPVTVTSTTSVVKPSTYSQTNKDMVKALTDVIRKMSDKQH
jgi:hypothetical protein